MQLVVQERFTGNGAVPFRTECWSRNALGVLPLVVLFEYRNFWAYVFTGGESENICFPAFRVPRYKLNCCSLFSFAVLPYSCVVVLHTSMLSRRIILQAHLLISAGCIENCRRCAAVMINLYALKNLYALTLLATYAWYLHEWPPQGTLDPPPPLHPSVFAMCR